jgi:hypothetical protein
MNRLVLGFPLLTVPPLEWNYFSINKVALNATCFVELKYQSLNVKFKLAHESGMRQGMVVVQSAQTWSISTSTILERSQVNFLH